MKPKGKNIVTCFILSLVFVTGGYANPIYSIKHFTSEDGFLNNEITQIIQDNKGLIWLSTWNGLASYDGYNFRYFSLSGQADIPYGDNRINNIVLNSKGNIFCVGRDNKIYEFNTITKRFSNLLKIIDLEIKNHNATYFYSLKKGVTWISNKDNFCLRIVDSLSSTKKGVELVNTKIKGKHIFSVFQDKDQDEWILTDKGISVFGKKKFIGEDVFHYITENKGTLWLVNQYGKLAKYNEQTSTCEYVNLPSFVYHIFCIQNLRDGRIALAANDCLVFIDTETAQFSTAKVQLPGQQEMFLHSIYEDSQGDLWLSAFSEGVLRYDTKKNQFNLLKSPPTEQPVVEEKPNVFYVNEDNNGNLIVVPRNGSICYYDRDSEQLNYFSTELHGEKLTHILSSRQYCKDNQGNFWIGSQKGLSRITFYKNLYSINDISYDEWGIRALMQDGAGNLWAASRSGYIRIYDGSNKLLGYLSDNGRLINKKTPFGANIYTMLEDKQGRIWLGSKKSGLFLLEKNSKGFYDIQNFRNEKENPYSLSYNDVYSVYQDKKDNIWIGCHGKKGLNLVQQNNRGEIYFINGYNRMKNYPDFLGHGLRCITEDNNGTILVGGINGLMYFSSDFVTPEDIRFLNMRLKDNDIIQIQTGTNGKVYLITMSGGLSEIKFDAVNNDSIEIKSYKNQNELFSGGLSCSLLKDKEGNLWIITKNAISRFEIERNSFENFQGPPFTPLNIIFMESTIMEYQGQIMIGSDLGIFTFDPDNFKKSNYIPSLIFTGISILGEKEEREIPSGEEIVLKPKQRTISVDFSAIDYTSTENIKYKYMLSGVDKTWNYTDNNKSATYSNVSKGVYTLYVESTNAQGKWVNNRKFLVFNFKPGFWESKFGTIVIILFVLLLIALTVIILNTIFRLKHRIEVEKQTTKSRINFFTDVSHELRTPLTLIDGPVTDIIENESLADNVKKKLIIVNENTKRLLRLINQILDFRKVQSDKMKLILEQTEIVQYLTKIMDGFSLLTEENNIRFELDSSDLEVPVWIDRDKFEKIFYNLFSNAFKYTKPGKSVIVRLEKGPAMVTISVIDEGVGISAQKISQLFRRFETIMSENLFQPSSGIGLSLTKDFVEMHHGSITVNSTFHQGSEFTLSFPLDKSIFDNDANVEYVLNDTNNEESTSGLDLSNLTSNRNSEDDISILVVEDNTDLAYFIHDFLSRNYNVKIAQDGLSGFELAKKWMPDLILTDILMPQLNGLEMINKLKENSNTCHIPVIILSAKSSMDDKILGLETGIDNYITKPFNSNYLNARIKSIIKQRKAVQKYYLAKLDDQSTECDEHTPYSLSENNNSFVKTVIEYIEQNIDKTDLKIDDIAQNLFISRTVLYKKIKTFFGMSPVNLIRHYRINKSKLLIKESDSSLSEIADLCGFGNLAYFSLCFKKETGMSPSEYKKSKVLNRS